MAVKVYGVRESRTYRVLWMLEECGVPYEHVRQSFAGEKPPEYLALNPSGKVPTLDDHGLVIFESLAVNLYLAKKYGDALGPRDASEEALMNQWSFWVATEVEKFLFDAFVAKTGILAELGTPRDEAQGDAHFARLERPLKVLDGVLANRPWLVGERFTVADLNVASVLLWTRLGKFDLSPRTNVHAWFQRATNRPAAARAAGVSTKPGVGP
jgi:glutathione S-transferase